MPTCRLIHPTDQIEDFIVAVQGAVFQHQEIAPDCTDLLSDLREAIVHVETELIHVQGEAGDEFTVPALAFEDRSHLAPKALKLAQHEIGWIGGLGAVLM
jgi:hypothetical protein